MRRGDPAGVGRRPRQAEPRQRRHDEVERVGRIPAVRAGIAQRTGDVEELRDRPRPPVAQHQRERVGLRRADVRRVDRRAVDLRHDLRPGVQPGLPRPPVVAVAPALRQRAHVVQRRAAVPAQVRRIEGPPRPAQALVEVGDRRVRHLDPVRVHALLLGSDGVALARHRSRAPRAASRRCGTPRPSSPATPARACAPPRSNTTGSGPGRT